MSQSRFLHEEYSKKIRKVAIKAAIDVAVADLVAAINVRHSNGGKRLTKGDQLYKCTIASLQARKIDITHNALKKRVSRASVEQTGISRKGDKIDNICNITVLSIQR